MDQTQIEALRAQPVAAFSHLIEGQHVPASDGGTMEVLSPIDGQPLTTCCARDSRRHGWPQLPLRVRRSRIAAGRGNPLRRAKKVLMKWADLIDAHALELAVLGVRDNGTEIGMAIKAEPGSAAGTIRYYAEALDKIYGEDRAHGPDVLA